MPYIDFQLLDTWPCITADALKLKISLEQREEKQQTTDLQGKMI